MDDALKTIIIVAALIAFTACTISTVSMFHSERMAKAGMCQKFQPGCGTLWVKCSTETYKGK